MAAQDVSFVEENNPWSVFVMEDGTRLKVRPILVWIKTTDKFLPDGQPAYDTRVQIIIDQSAPERAVKPSGIIREL